MSSLAKHCSVPTSCSCLEAEIEAVFAEGGGRGDSLSCTLLPRCSSLLSLLLLFLLGLLDLDGFRSRLCYLLRLRVLSLLILLLDSIGALGRLLSERIDRPLSRLCDAQCYLAYLLCGIELGQRCCCITHR